MATAPYMSSRPIQSIPIPPACLWGWGRSSGTHTAKVDVPFVSGLSHYRSPGLGLGVSPDRVLPLQGCSQLFALPIKCG